MRNLLAFLAAAVVAFGVVGWCLDWYRFRTVPSPDGNPSVTVDFHPQKMSDDIAKAQAAVEKQLADRKAKLESDRKAAEAKKADIKPAEEKADEKADANFSDEEETEEAPLPAPVRKRDR
jgi:hypothetical protein